MPHFNTPNVHALIPFCEPPRSWATSELFRVNNRYSVVRLLGQGSFGSVFLAIDEVEFRRVALKVLSPVIAPTWNGIERFKREAEALQRLGDGTRIVKLCDYGETTPSTSPTGLPFICMDYLPGRTLKQMLDEWHYLPQFEAIRIAVDIARALELVSSSDYGHRDIKPANVIQDILHGARFCVIDLGLAFCPDNFLEDLTHGYVAGTTRYMAPERLRNRVYEASAPTDLYSLGCVLYEMLGGEHPFPQQQIVDHTIAKQNGTFPPLRSKRPEVSAELEQLTHELLDPNPRLRPQTPQVVVERLLQVCEQAKSAPVSGHAQWPKVSSGIMEDALRSYGASALELPQEWSHASSGLLLSMASRKEMSLQMVDAAFKGCDTMLKIQFDVRRQFVSEVREILKLSTSLLAESVKLGKQLFAKAQNLPRFCGHITQLVDALHEFNSLAVSWCLAESTVDGEVDSASWGMLEKIVWECLCKLLDTEHELVQDQVFLADLLLAEIERQRLLRAA